MSKHYPFSLLLVGIVALVTMVVPAVADSHKTDSDTTISDSASLYFSSALINERISRTITETQPVNENIMDTPITGTTHLKGNIQSSLVPKQDAGMIRILLKAQSQSTTTGTHWPVILHDQSQGKLIGSIDILLNGLDFSTENEKAAADIHVTNQQVQSEVGNSGWVLSIAKDKIRDSEPEANLEAESLAEGKIREQLKEQVTTVLQNAREQIETNLIDPLDKDGLKPNSVQFQTTNAWLILTTNWDKAASSSTPPFTAFAPSADLVAMMPEAIFIKVVNSLTDRHVKSIDELESEMVEVNLPKSWKQPHPLKLIKKEKRGDNLILQWSRQQ